MKTTPDAAAAPPILDDSPHPPIAPAGPDKPPPPAAVAATPTTTTRRGKRQSAFAQGLRALKKSLVKTKETPAEEEEEEEEEDPEELHARLLARLGTSFRNSQIWEEARQRTKVFGTWRFVLHPHSRLRTTWDWTILLLVLYNAILLPFNVAFEPSYSDSWIAVDYFVDVLFFLDIVANFRTAFFDTNRVLVQDDRTIAWRYLHGWFFVDFISTIPLELIVKGALGDTSVSELTLLSALKCLRLFRLGRFVKVFERMQFANIAGIVRLYVFILLICHWFACSWYLMVRHTVDPYTEENWLIANGFDERDLGSQYIAALLAALLALFRTIGTELRTDGERIFLFIATLGGAALNATIFGQVAHLISSMNARPGEHRKFMRALFERMEYYNIPDTLKQRISLYFESMWDMHRIINGESMNGFTRHLSEPLKLEVNLWLNRDMIEKVPMFRETDTSVIVHVIRSLESHLFMPGDYIVRLGEVGDRMFFVRRGECAVLIKKKEDEGAPAALPAPSSSDKDADSNRPSASTQEARPEHGTAVTVQAPPVATSTVSSTTPGAPGSLGAAGSPSTSEAPNPDAARPALAAPAPRLHVNTKGETMMQVNVLRDGNYFGEIALLFRMKRTATVCSLTFSDLASLNRDNFEHILDEHPEFAEKIEKNFANYLQPQAPIPSRAHATTATGEPTEADEEGEERVPEDGEDDSRSPHEFASRRPFQNGDSEAPIVGSSSSPYRRDEGDEADSAEGDDATARRRTREALSPSPSEDEDLEAMARDREEVGSVAGYGAPAANSFHGDVEGAGDGSRRGITVPHFLGNQAREDSVRSYHAVLNQHALSLARSPLFSPSRRDFLLEGLDARSPGGRAPSARELHALAAAHAAAAAAAATAAAASSSGPGLPAPVPLHRGPHNRSAASVASAMLAAEVGSAFAGPGSVVGSVVGGGDGGGDVGDRGSVASAGHRSVVVRDPGGGDGGEVQVDMWTPVPRRRGAVADALRRRIRMQTITNSMAVARSAGVSPKAASRAVPSLDAGPAGALPRGPSFQGRTPAGDGRSLPTRSAANYVSRVGSQQSMASYGSVVPYEEDGVHRSPQQARGGELDARRGSQGTVDSTFGLSHRGPVPEFGPEGGGGGSGGGGGGGGAVGAPMRPSTDGGAGRDAMGPPSLRTPPKDMMVAGMAAAHAAASPGAELARSPSPSSSPSSASSSTSSAADGTVLNPRLDRKYGHMVMDQIVETRERAASEAQFSAELTSHGRPMVTLLGAARPGARSIDSDTTTDRQTTASGGGVPVPAANTSSTDASERVVMADVGAGGPDLPHPRDAGIGAAGFGSELAAGARAEGPGLGSVHSLMMSDSSHGSGVGGSSTSFPSPAGSAEAMAVHRSRRRASDGQVISVVSRLRDAEEGGGDGLESDASGAAPPLSTTSSHSQSLSQSRSSAGHRTHPADGSTHRRHGSRPRPEPEGSGTGVNLSFVSAASVASGASGSTATGASSTRAGGAPSTHETPTPPPRRSSGTGLGVQVGRFHVSTDLLDKLPAHIREGVIETHRREEERLARRAAAEGTHKISLMLKVAKAASSFRAKRGAARGGTATATAGTAEDMTEAVGMEEEDDEDAGSSAALAAVLHSRTRRASTTVLETRPLRALTSSSGLAASTKASSSSAASSSALAAATTTMQSASLSPAAAVAASVAGATSAPLRVVALGSGPSHDADLAQLGSRISGVLSASVHSTVGEVRRDVLESIRGFETVIASTLAALHTSLPALVAQATEKATERLEARIAEVLDRQQQMLEEQRGVIAALHAALIHVKGEAARGASAEAARADAEPHA